MSVVSKWADVMWWKGLPIDPGFTVALSTERIARVVEGTFQIALARLTTGAWVYVEVAILEYVEIIIH